MRRLFLLCLLMVLGACVTRPTFMPSGYEWHGGEDGVNAPPGAPADDLGYKYSPEANRQQQMLWSKAAKDLVGKIEAAGLKAQPVYVEPLPVSNAFNNSLDYALREELRARGYTLIAAPGENLHLRYEMWREGGDKIVRRPLYNEDKNIYTKSDRPGRPENFVFALSMLQNREVFGTVTTIRAMPSYGYVTGDSVRKTPDRLTEKLIKEIRQ